LFIKKYIGNNVMGKTGRWRRALINKIAAATGGGKTIETALNDFSISPKIRQLLQHWGYCINLKDLKAGIK
jgi:hypothetical protein